MAGSQKNVWVDGTLAVSPSSGPGVQSQATDLTGLPTNVTVIGGSDLGMILGAKNLLYVCLRLTGTSASPSSSCAEPISLGDGVEVQDILGSYVLTNKALLLLERNGSGSTVVATKLVDGDFASIVDDTGTYRRSLAVLDSCVAFSGAQGLSYWAPKTRHTGLVTAPPSGTAILGLSPTPFYLELYYDAKLAFAAYGVANEGGGFYSVDTIPTECSP